MRVSRTLHYIIISLFFLVQYQNLNAQFTAEQHIYGTQTTGPRRVTISDLNNDGIKDVIFPRVVGNKLTYYLGDGTLYYQQQSNISCSSMPGLECLAGDLDQDGDQDLVYISTSTSISWWKNDGNGNFSDLQIVGTLPVAGANEVQLGDINGDGLTDVICNNSWAQTMIWYPNLGGGIFDSPVTFGTSVSAITRILCFDIDSDGDQDVITASNAQDEVLLYLNAGGGTFGTIQLASTIEASEFDFADLNGDGQKDLIVASFTQDKIVWYERIGTTSFGSEQLIYSCDYPVELTLDDIDSDGDVDVLAGIYYDHVFLALKNNGTGSLFQADTIQSNTNPVGIASGDLDNDGDIDLITTSDNGYSYSYENISGSLSSFEFGNISNYATMATGDFNLDGNGDFVVADVNSKRVFLFKGNGNGFEVTGENIFSGNPGIGPVNKIAVEDADNDGDLDYLTGTYNKLYLLKNDGFGLIADTIIISDTLDSPQELVMADIDTDGFLDVVGACVYDYLFWYKFDGMNVLSSVVVENAMHLTEDVEVGDLDVDGDLDILTAERGNHTVSWFENDLNGSSWTRHNITTSAPGAKDVDMGDFNNDGAQDILSISEYDNRITVFWNDGFQNFPDSTILDIALDAYTGGEIWDIDSDGKLDILAYSRLGDKIVLFKNLGSGTFSSPVIVSNTVDGIGSMGLVDCDNNGVIDIVAGTGADSELSWIKNYYSGPLRLSGTLFFDQNLNSTIDPGDILIENQMTQVTPNIQSSSSLSNGLYEISVASPGAYIISPPSIPGWSISTDSLTFNRSINLLNPIEDSCDFGFFYDSIFHSLATEMASGWTRCDDTVLISIDITNFGSVVDSASLNVILDPSLEYVGASIPYDSISSNNIYFHIYSISSFQTGQILIKVKTPNYLSTGDTLWSNLLVNDMLGNVYLDSLSQIVYCAFDPNDKLVSPAGFGEQGYVPMETTDLEYIVRFQNTGNDTAQFVLIKDHLDTNLNWNSFQIVQSSHSVQCDLFSDGLVDFKFFGINLPDSSTDFIGSQGFVKYRIGVTPGVTPGTLITNNASIYFDYNPPVTTNTTMSTFYSCENALEVVNIPSLICSGDTISFQESSLSTTYNWSINGGISQNSAFFSWVADSSGSHLIHLNISNPLCNLDTLINVTVLPGIDTITANGIGICPGDSILFGGNYIGSAGQYYGLFQSINGCDSVVLQPIYLYQNLQQETDSVLLCSGESMQLYGQQINSGGMYFDTIQSFAGCDSILSTYVELIQSQIVLFNQTLPDTICMNDSPIALSGGLPSGGQYSGVGVVNSIFYPANSTQGNISIFYSYSDINGCLSSDSVSVFVDGCVSIIEHDMVHFTVSPNPFQHYTLIEFNQYLNGQYTLEMIDLLGQSVVQIPGIIGESCSLKNLTLGQGIYLILLKDISENIVGSEKSSDLLDKFIKARLNIELLGLDRFKRIMLNRIFTT